MSTSIGKQSRNRGRNYEYSVRNFLRSLGYKSERVILSGGCDAINKLTGSKNDVIGDKNGLKVDIECKKTSGKKHIIIKKDALTKIKFYDEETERIGMLSFSFGGDTTNYAIIPLNDLLLMLEKLFGDQDD